MTGVFSFSTQDIELNRREAESLLSRFPEALSGGDPCFFSATTSRMGPVTSQDFNYSIFAPLPPGRLGLALMLPPTRLYPGQFARAWFAHLMEAVAAGGRLYVPFTAGKSTGELLRYCDLPWLEQTLGPAIHVDTATKLAAFPAADGVLGLAQSVLSLYLREPYALLWGLFAGIEQEGADDFLIGGVPHSEDISSPEFALDTAETKAGIAQAFFSRMNYLISGISYKSAGLEELLKRFLPERDGLGHVDLGGGPGFLSAELLLSGHRMAESTVCEPSRENLPLARHLYAWFHTSLQSRFKFYPAPAQSLQYTASVDLVSAFAALLFVPRHQLGATLQNAWDALRSGGLLVIHENIKRDHFRRMSYYHQMFTAQELDAELGRFGEVHRFRSSDLKNLTRDEAGDLTVYRVLCKP